MTGKEYGPENECSVDSCHTSAILEVFPVIAGTNNHRPRRRLLVDDHCTLMKAIVVQGIYLTYSIPFS